MSEAVSASSTGGSPPPPADLPASALPPGVDPASYIAEKTSASLPDPTPKTAEQIRQHPRPDHIPEKFWDATTGQVRTEALLKSYSELEKMRGKPVDDSASTQADTSTDPAQPEDSAKIERKEDSKEGDKPAEDDSKPAPLAETIQSVVSKYNEGKIEEADFAALESQGLPRQVVETYFAGLKALEEATLLSAHEAAGGKETFDAARQWAASSLNDADFEFYNNNVANPKTARAAVEWLVQKYNAAVPSEGRSVSRTSPTLVSGSVFRSQQELASAMSDPKYKADPAFRQEVAEKLLRSRQAGTLSSNVQYYEASGRR